jgi:tetratricopeptide (TPR) repeat protein
MPGLREARLRHAAHYARLLGDMKAEYLEVADRNGVVSRFDRDWDQLQVGQAWAAGAMSPDSGDADLAFVFASHADPLVGLRHRPEIVRRWIAAGLTHDIAVKDPGVLAENLSRIATTHFNAGELEDARRLWRQALEAHRTNDKASDPHYFEMQEAGYEANLGNAEDRLGNAGAARAAYEHARETFHRLGEQQQEGRMLLNLGTLYAAEDADEEAVALYRRAIEIADIAVDIEGRELALGALGNSLANLERLDEARDSIESALALARELGDKASEALRLGNLGKVLLRQGDQQGALRVRSVALALAREIGDPRTEALQLHGIGEIYAERKQDDQAESLFAEAEGIFLGIGMHQAAEPSRRSRASAQKRRSLRTAIDQYNERINEGNPEEAIQTLNRWSALGYDPTPYQRSLLVGLYAFAEHVAGRLDRAAELFAQALQLDDELPPGELTANHLGNVGDLYRHLGDGEHAVAAYAAAAGTADIPDDVREKLTYGLALAREIGTEHEGGSLNEELAQDLALQLINGITSGEVVQVYVLYDEGFTISGQCALVELGSGFPEITLQIVGGWPLKLAFGRIADLRLVASGSRQ